ncbi:hypothetical protein [Bdellovibrio bacteriovorus]|uniref:hypothetical protein n=1 Tax=Bdellovibrio TaxID=958 RepID=UPI0035A9147F
MKKTDLNDFLNLLNELVVSNKEIMSELDRSLMAVQVIGVTPAQMARVRKPIVDLKELTRVAEEMKVKIKQFDEVE